MATRAGFNAGSSSESLSGAQSDAARRGGVLALDPGEGSSRASWLAPTRRA